MISPHKVMLHTPPAVGQTTCGGAVAFGHLRWGGCLRLARAGKKAREWIYAGISTEFELGGGSAGVCNRNCRDNGPTRFAASRRPNWRAAGPDLRSSSSIERSRGRGFHVRRAVEEAPSAAKRSTLERRMLSQPECERPVARTAWGPCRKGKNGVGRIEGFGPGTGSVQASSPRRISLRGAARIERR